MGGRYVAAPFWTMNDVVSLVVEVFRENAMETDQNYLRMVSNFVSQRTMSDFNATLLVLSRWLETPSSPTDSVRHT